MPNQEPRLPAPEIQALVSDRRFRLASYQSRNDPITNPKAAPIAMCTMRFVFETIAPFVPTSVPTTNGPSDQYHFFTVTSLHRACEPTLHSVINFCRSRHPSP